MSDTVAAAPSALPPRPTTATPGFFASFVAAVEHGAGLVYHKVLAVEADLTQWTADHQDIAPLLAVAEQYVTTVLAGFGISVPEVVNVSQAVLGALGKMAAADMTIASGSNKS